MPVGSGRSIPGAVRRQDLEKIQNRGGQTVTEELLPVESVQEYFEHFSILELDFTFYGLLLDDHSNPTRPIGFSRLTGEISRMRTASFSKFLRRFLPRNCGEGKVCREPWVPECGDLHSEILCASTETPGPNPPGLHLRAGVPGKERAAFADLFVSALDRFFEHIPKDDRYHVEVRTEGLLTKTYFEVLEKHGIGQVLSHWTWLPPLRKQFSKGSGRFLNAGKQVVIRLMTPIGMRYEEAYLKAFPFDKWWRDDESSHAEETAEVMSEAIKQDVKANVIINNRAGGNARSSPEGSREIHTEQ